MVHLIIMKPLLLFLGIISLLFFLGCKKTDTPAPVDPCLNANIVPIAAKTHSVAGQALGTITVTSPIGSGFSYSIGGDKFQPSTNFFTLVPGTYTLTAKNADGCIGKLAVTINGYGPKFYNVRTIVNGYCGPCHLNGSVSGGKNFDDDNSIVISWDRIKARAVDGSPTFMPQGGQLTAIDKQKIVDWVNAGHKITD
jgi:hypothetical protein